MLSSLMKSDLGGKALPRTHVAVVLRVGGNFPQLYLNGQPEELEDATTPWSELEDIVYKRNQYLIIGQAAFEVPFWSRFLHLLKRRKASTCGKQGFECLK